MILRRTALPMSVVLSLGLPVMTDTLPVNGPPELPRHSVESHSEAKTGITESQR